MEVTLWLWDEAKDGLRNAQAEEMGREEKGVGNEKEGKARRRDFY